MESSDVITVEAINDPAELTAVILRLIHDPRLDLDTKLVGVVLAGKAGGLTDSAVDDLVRMVRDVDEP